VNDFDRRVIEASIRSRVGHVERIDLCGREYRTPMTVFIESAERALDQPIELFWIDDGIPGYFCLVGERQLAVVFHTRELILTSYLRGIISNDALSKVFAIIGERIALKLVAEFLLQRGFVDQALQTYARSAFNPSLTSVEPTLDLLEAAQRDEVYLGAWFLGLGHEIGHFLKPSVREALLEQPAFSVRRISAAIDRHIDQQYPDPSMRDILRQIIRRSDKPAKSPCYAAPSAITEEAASDVFSVLAITESAAGILGRCIIPESLLVECALITCGLSFINQCRVLAKWFTDHSQEVERQNLALSNLALQIRLNLVLESVTDCEFHEVMASTFPSVARFADLDVDWLNRTLNTVASYGQNIGEGLTVARDFISSREMRDTSIFYEFLDKIRSDPYLAYDSKGFVMRARLLPRRSPELEMLAEIVERL
jgi:hypothetical protein